METTALVSRKLSSYGLNIAIVVVFLGVFVLIGFLNAKVDAVKNRNLLVTLDLPAFSGTNDSHELVWEQPANTILQGDAHIVCTSAAHVASGNIGWKVGTTSGGTDVANYSYDILHTGTTVPVGAVFWTGFDGFSTRNNAAPAAGHLYTTVKRKLYFAVTHTTAATAPGKFKIIFELYSTSS